MTALLLSHSEGRMLRLAMPPNTMMKIRVVSSGWITNQAGPRMVCLNWATKSRRTNIATRSR